MVEIIISAVMFAVIAIAFTVALSVGSKNANKKIAFNRRVFRFYSDREMHDGTGKNTVFAMDYRVKGRRPFVIVCPGGGYANVAVEHEGISTAKELNRLGYSAFVLKYRCGVWAKHPAPQEDIARLIRYILENAEILNVEKSYAVIGFSAGGHVASSICTKALGFRNYGIPAPEATILAYPSTTMKKNYYLDTNYLVGNDAPQEIMELWTVENNLDGDYPPTFIWGREGDTISIDCSRRIKERLTALNVPVIHEVYVGSEHGEALGTGKPMQGWVGRAVAFWQRHKKEA